MKNFINRAFAEGATITNVQEFVNSVIPPAPRRFWEPGCFLSIPEDFTLMEQPVSNANGSESKLPFLVVKVEFPDGFVQWDKLFLGTLTRGFRLPNGKVIAAHGTAVDFIRSFPTWADALNALRGKTLKVVEDVVYEVPSPCGSGHHKTHIFGFDL